MSMDQKIEEAYNEDMPKGDITTDSLELNSRSGRARLVAREDLILSGLEIFEKCIKKFDANAKLNWHFEDGDLVIQDQTLCTIQSGLGALIKAERVALNFLGHLSGIATLTRCFVKELEGTECTLLDTRKTLPGLRNFEKRAVVHGGGTNHRMNLSDGVLIKENHIRLAGGIQETVEQIRKKTDQSITVEVTNLDEAQQAIDLKVDRLLLDNMTNEDMAKAVELTPANIETEASGNMDLERLRGVAETGVNFISVGAITHSAPCADMSLLIEESS